MEYAVIFFSVNEPAKSENGKENENKEEEKDQKNSTGGQ